MIITINPVGVQHIQDQYIRVITIWLETGQLSATLNSVCVLMCALVSFADLTPQMSPSSSFHGSSSVQNPKKNFQS